MRLYERYNQLKAAASRTSILFFNYFICQQNGIKIAFKWRYKLGKISQSHNKKLNEIANFKSAFGCA